MSRYQPALIHVDPDDWAIFREIHETGNLSARIRELVKEDIDRFTREEIKAQSFAGITEA